MSISHMMSDIKKDDENFDDQSWNHHSKNKFISKHRKWLKKIHFIDVQKVYFHKILLDEWEEIHLMDFNQLHSFLIFIQFEWILWKLKNWSKLYEKELIWFKVKNIIEWKKDEKW